MKYYFFIFSNKAIFLIIHLVFSHATARDWKSRPGLPLKLELCTCSPPLPAAPRLSSRPLSPLPAAESASRPAVLCPRQIALACPNSRESPPIGASPAHHRRLAADEFIGRDVTGAGVTSARHRGDNTPPMRVPGGVYGGLIRPDGRRS